MLSHVRRKTQSQLTRACQSYLLRCYGSVAAAETQQAHSRVVQYEIESHEPADASMTPREIVNMLDRHIVGQHAAKKAVANALRNRWRRRQIESPLKDEIVPKNILMLGPTGMLLCCGISYASSTVIVYNSLQVVGKQRLPGD